MKLKSEYIVERLKILIPFLLIAGVLIFFFVDKIVGGAFLFAGGLVIVYAIVLCAQAKKKKAITPNRLSGYFFICIGIFVFVLVFINFIAMRVRRVLYALPLGILYLVYGIYMLKSNQITKSTWEKMPLGFKLVIFYLAMSALLSFFNLEARLKEPNLFLGIIIYPPISSIFAIILFLIPLVAIYLITQKTRWELLLGLISFNVINGILGGIRILTMPLSQLFALSSRSLPDASPEVLQNIEMLSKLIMSVPMLIGIGIIVLIAVYIYKRKKYFIN